MSSSSTTRAGTHGDAAPHRPRSPPDRDPRGPSYYTTGRRLRGYRKALRQSGIEVDEALVVTLRRGTTEEATAATHALLTSPHPPTAIFSTTGFLTEGVLRASQQLQARIAVVGFDDFKLADMLPTPVTVVTSDIEELGRRAAHLLIDRINGEDSPFHRTVLPSRLIARGTGRRLPGSGSVERRPQLARPREHGVELREGGLLDRLGAAGRVEVHKTRAGIAHRGPELVRVVGHRLVVRAVPGHRLQEQQVLEEDRVEVHRLGEQPSLRDVVGVGRLGDPLGPAQICAVVGRLVEKDVDADRDSWLYDQMVFSTVPFRSRWSQYRAPGLCRYVFVQS